MSISFLFIYVSTTGLLELSKVPVLVAHFVEHSQQEGGITLSEFLNMHYTENSTPDADHDRDMELPFKTQHEAVSSLLMAAVPPISFEWSICSSASAMWMNFPEWDEFLVSGVFSSIWQPPRFV